MHFTADEVTAALKSKTLCNNPVINRYRYIQNSFHSLLSVNIRNMGFTFKLYSYKFVITFDQAFVQIILSSLNL
jgi:hypothetical protein